jgi:hypothetical protein
LNPAIKVLPPSGTPRDAARDEELARYMSSLDLAVSVALGVGLAAAIGFRLFLPLLVLSIAAYSGHASLNESFAWLGTPAAMIMLGTAAIAEIAAF